MKKQSAFFAFFSQAHLPRVQLISNGAALLFVGDELLSGKIINTTAAPLAKLLQKAQLQIMAMRTCCDDSKVIARELRNLDVPVVVVSGGLGPTSDDVTMQGAAQAFDVPLALDARHAEYLENHFAQRKKTAKKATINEKVGNSNDTSAHFFEGNKEKKIGISLEMRIKRQASIPLGAVAVAHPFGTAPLVVFVYKKRYFIFVAGVPYEALNIVEKYVLPWLKSGNRYKNDAHNSYSFTVLGKLESQLENDIQSLAVKSGVKLPSLSLAENIEKGTLKENEENVKEISTLDNGETLGVSYLPRGGRVVQITIRGENGKGENNNKEEAVKQFAKVVVQHFHSQVDLLLYEGDAALPQKLHEVLIRLCQHANVALGFAESCSGGMLASMVTQMAGAAQYFYGSMVTYANNAKTNLVDVGANIIKKYGAVSEQVVLAMADGMAAKLVQHLQRTSNLKKKDTLQIVASVTGIAGPSGGTANKPVGTVWMGFVVRGNVSGKKVHIRYAQQHYFFGDRELVRTNTCLKFFSSLLFLLRDADVFQQNFPVLGLNFSAANNGK